jgi:hypothetical protein
MITIETEGPYFWWTDDEYWRARLHWLALCACIARGA